MARVPTTIEAVLSAIKARILAYCPVSLPDAADVWLSLASDADIIDSAPHDRFVTVRPLTFPPDQGIVTGAGAGTFSGLAVGSTAVGEIPLIMTVEVALWVRLLTDEQGADDDFLIGSLGVLPLWRKVLAALQLYDPTSGGDLILSEPMRLIPGGRVDHRGRSNYGKLESFWECRFICELPPSGG